MTASVNIVAKNFINAAVISEVLALAFAADLGEPGLSTRRAVGQTDIDTLAAEIKRGGKYVRVYSEQGFVANSYRSHCQIQYLTAELVSAVEGEWRVTIGWGSAQRSHGKGSLVVTR